MDDDEDERRDNTVPPAVPRDKRDWGSLRHKLLPHFPDSRVFLSHRPACSFLYLTMNDYSLAMRFRV